MVWLVFSGLAVGPAMQACCDPTWVASAADGLEPIMSLGLVRLILREMLGIVKNASLSVVEEGLRSGKNANIDRKRRKLRFFMPYAPSKPQANSPLSHENAK